MATIAISILDAGCEKYDTDNTVVEDLTEIDMSIGGSTTSSGSASFYVDYTDKSTSTSNGNNNSNGSDTDATGSDATGSGATDSGATDSGATVIETSGTTIVEFSLTVQKYSYCKQMYRPNEITMLVQIAPKQDSDSVVRTATIEKAKLKKAFCNKQVTVVTTSTIENTTYQTTDSDFYIHEITPVYKSDAIYVTMHLFSPDKKMTLKPESRTFVSKQLKKDILNGIMSGYKLPYDSTKSFGWSADNMKTLISGGNEHIFPYLVQYNESFYDFLARTTNRWGEFLYWEGGQLNIGYTVPADDNTAEINKYDSYTFVDLSETTEDMDSYNSEATYDNHVQNNILRKDSYDKVVGQLGSSQGWDTYIFRKVSQLLSFDVNIYDWVVGTLVDDSVALAQAEIISKAKNDKFNKDYFSSTSDIHYGIREEEDAKNKNKKNKYQEYNEFTEYSSGLEYLTVLKNEVAASRNIIVIDLDTNWQNLTLGQVFKFNGTKYIVTKIEASQADHYAIKNQKVVLVSDVTEAGITFKITAIKDTSTDTSKSLFYPTVIPAGHVRKSDPQIAQVTDNDDPLRQNRVRIKYDWDAKNTESPWLVFTTPIGNKKLGLQGRHHKGDNVLVSYHYGNIERPYVSGAVPSELPKSLNTNDIVCVTPGGQTIKMSDGTGAGATAMVTNLLPGMKFISGFFPASDWFTTKKSDGSISDDDNTVKSRYFEGNIELSDKYGIWSIKGSTDSRNISIKSAWGDVNINAWSGITISAPNGDVKIKGKNVSIEAGNNLTLTSGKNVKDKWYPTLMKYESATAFAVNLAAYLLVAVAKKLAQMAFNLIDITIIRNLFETFVKPVEGQLKVSSQRFLMLEAGGAAAAYPIDAKKASNVAEEKSDVAKALATLREIPGIVNSVVTDLTADYTLYKESVSNLKDIYEMDTMGTEGPFKEVNMILSDLWGGNSLDENSMNFKGKLQDVNSIDDLNGKRDLINALAPQPNPNYEVTQDIFNTVHLSIELRRGSVMTAVNNLKPLIDKMRKFEYLTSAMAGKAVFKNNKITSMISTVSALEGTAIPTLLADDDFKKGNKNTPLLSADEIKKTRKALYLKAITAFGLEQFSNTSHINKVTGIADPLPAVGTLDSTDEAWGQYVDSLGVVIQKKPDADVWQKILSESIKKPLEKGIKPWTDFGKNTTDHFAYSADNKGQILFTAKPGTMVLGEDIYRANGDYLTTTAPDIDADPLGAGTYLDKIHAALKL